MSQTQLEIQSVVDRVYDAVRSRIVSGELAEGARLHQTSLADELGVSRTPLREALRRLSTEGLVELAQNRGAIVTPRNPALEFPSWQARVTLEPAAARAAAGTREPGAMRAMADAVEQQRAVVDDLAGSFKVNREFHLALVGAAANPQLSQFARMLWLTSLSESIFSRQATTHPEEVARWADEHKLILAAVADGNGERAERLTREHILASPVVVE